MLQRTKNKEQRIISLDLLRAFAIATVVLCHATENIYVMNQEFLSQISVQSRLFAITSFTVGRLGVPIFIFTTGYLLLTRKYDDKYCLKFWRKNWLGLVITTEIWIVLYNIFFVIFFNREFNVVAMLKNMLFLTQVPLSHMWYMPMIVGMYVFIPLVANAVQSISVKVLTMPMMFCAGVLFGLPVVGLPSSLDLNFSGGIYGLMLICGYLVYKQCYRKYNANILIALGVISFMITVGAQYLAYHSIHGFNVWYNSATLVVCSLVIFELGTRVKEIPFEAVLYDLSRCSFGIYLIHNPILLFVLLYVPFQGLLPIRVILLWLIVFILSWFIVHFISKIPKVGKYLFFMK